MTDLLSTLAHALGWTLDPTYRRDQIGPSYLVLDGPLVPGVHRGAMVSRWTVAGLMDMAGVRGGAVMVKR